MRVASLVCGSRDVGGELRILSEHPHLETFLEAAENGEAETMAALMQNGLGVNTANEQGHTALVLAAEEGHIDCVRLLLRDGAKPNGINSDGAPLLSACMRPDNVEVIRALIAHGADVNHRGGKNAGGLTALMHCAGGEEEDFSANLTELLKHRPDLEARTGADESALSYAVSCGDLKAVDVLLAAGANVNAAVCGGTTLIGLTLESGASGVRAWLRVLELLLAGGADVDLEDDRGQTALTAAILHLENEEDALEAVDRLAARSKDINRKNRHGYTPFEIAIKHGREAVAVLLESMGANVD